MTESHLILSTNMDILKFKAYDEKKLVYKEFFVKDGKAYTLENNSCPDSECGCDFGCYMQEHDWAVTWSIGLTDKEGFPIYTGDIIRLWNGQVCLVKYESFGFEFPDEGIGFSLSHNEKTKVVNGKILGNIYQNPEFNVWKK